MVTVTVTCRVPLADLALLRVPGAKTLTASYPAPIDVYREVSFGFVNSEGRLGTNPGPGGG